MDKKYKNYIILIGGGILVAFLMYYAPVMVDDYNFLSLDLPNLKDKLFYALQYGNGRLFGNIGVLYLVRYPVFRIIVKACTVMILIFFLVKLLGIEDENSVYLLFTFILILGMAPRMFGQVLTWTSGFQNYMPPVLCMLICLQITLQDSNKYKFIKMIGVFFIAISGQLFVEHSTIINLTIAILVVIAGITRKRRLIYGYVWGLGTFIGTIIMFLIPKLFYVPNEFENYQKLNLTDVKTLVISIFSNILYIGKMYSENYLLFISISITLLFIIWKQNKKYNNKLFKIAETILIFYPVLCMVNYLFTQNKLYFGTEIGRRGFFLCILLVYLLAVIYVTTLIEDLMVKNVALICLAMAVFAVSPLLIVYPIGERCLFHSYVFMIMMDLLLFKYALKLAKISYKYIKKMMQIFCIVLSLGLILTFKNIHFVEQEKIAYIQEQMEKKSLQIVIPKIPSEHLHSNENIMIEYYYFYKERGDIKFLTVDYKTWKNLVQQNNN